MEVRIYDRSKFFEIVGASYGRSQHTHTHAHTQRLQIRQGMACTHTHPPTQRLEIGLEKGQGKARTHTHTRQDKHPHTCTRLEARNMARVRGRNRAGNRVGHTKIVKHGSNTHTHTLVSSFTQTHVGVALC